MITTVPDTDADFIDQESVKQVHGDRFAARGRPARVGVVMMQKDEIRLLDPWLRYSAFIFGASNLHVLDNGSTDPVVLARLEQAEAEGVRVIRDYNQPEHAANRGAVVTEVLQRLEAEEPFDFLMPLDCSMFIAYLAPDGRVDTSTDGVLNYLNSNHKDDPKILMTRGAFLSLPGFKGFYHFKNTRRCFFASGSVGEVASAYHQGKSRRSDVEGRTALVHFHYRFLPYEFLDAAARADLDRPSEEFAAEGFRNFKGKLAEDAFRKMGEEEYLQFFRKFDRLPIASLRTALRRLGSDIPW